MFDGFGITTLFTVIEVSPLTIEKLDNKLEQTCEFQDMLDKKSRDMISQIYSD